MSPFAITVWSKPSCVQCTATKRALDKGGLVEGVDYEVKNLPDYPAMIEAFKTDGLMQAPNVESAYAETFSGYNVNLVKEIIAADALA